MTAEQQSLRKFPSYINYLRGMSLIAENIWVLIIAYYSTRMGRKNPPCPWNCLCPTSVPSNELYICKAQHGVLALTSRQWPFWHQLNLSQAPAGLLYQHLIHYLYTYSARDHRGCKRLSVSLSSWTSYPLYKLVFFGSFIPVNMMLGHLPQPWGPWDLELPDLITSP